jgi:galactose oxidase
MAFPRGFADANILPDGTILVTGGQRRSRIFTDIDTTIIPDLYDPETDTWTQLALSLCRGRTTPSLSCSPDGRIFSGDGGACDVKPGDSDAHCDRTIDHSDGQIFSPPYLFNANGTEAARPVISDLAQQPVKAGATLSFSISESLKSLSLIRLGSVTHSVNSDQRRIPLAFDIVEGAVATQLPSDYGILVPGFYYLFAVSEQGVPSIGKSVHVIL